METEPDRSGHRIYDRRKLKEAGNTVGDTLSKKKFLSLLKKTQMVYNEGRYRRQLAWRFATKQEEAIYYGNR